MDFGAEDRCRKVSDPFAQSDYAFRIRLLLRDLGIPETYGVDRQLPLQLETLPSDLESAGVDVFDRPQSLERQTAKSWSSLRDRALTEGIVLQLASAFRSVDYQHQIILKKLAGGRDIQEILRSSAAPGYSEHHTGRAIDITTPGADPFEEEFEKTVAFAWLQRCAGDFGFRLSYPRGNPHGVVYEPWHWFKIS